MNLDLITIARLATVYCLYVNDDSSSSITIISRFDFMERNFIVTDYKALELRTHNFVRAYENKNE